MLLHKRDLVCFLFLFSYKCPYSEQVGVKNKTTEVQSKMTNVILVDANRNQVHFTWFGIRHSKSDPRFPHKKYIMLYKVMIQSFYCLNILVFLFGTLVSWGLLRSLFLKLVPLFFLDSIFTFF